MHVLSGAYKDAAGGPETQKQVGGNMAATAVIVLQLLLGSMASASHLYGQNMVYTYRGRNPDGTFKVDFHNRATHRGGCWYSTGWRCSGSNCGSVSRTQTGVVDNANGACATEEIITRNMRSNKPFLLRANSCCWVYGRNGVSSWNAATSVDLGTRSDTRQPNRSPDFNVLSVLRVPQNCPRTYNLLTFDPDGDKVRCRYGNIPGVESTSCTLPSGFHLHQDSCTLRYLSTSAHSNVFALELVVEDFPQGHITLAYTDGTRSSRAPLTVGRGKRSITQWWQWYMTSTTTAPTTTTTPPLSKLPLQFSVRVDPAVPTCQEGIYLPRFVAPTPADGERFQAEVNKEMEIKVKAQATLSTIQNLLISGPMNISKHRNTLNEFDIKWTPVPEDVGHYFVICFAVESLRWPQTYQSEMRCVLVEVTGERVKPHVICNETSMTVLLEKDSFSGLHQDHLRLSESTNAACSLQTHSNSTHVIAVVPLNSCGTEIEEDENNLIFKNEITTVDDIRDVITRKHLLEVQFYCQYPKRGNVTLGFTAHRRNVTVWEKGFGTFTYQFEFYPNNQFQTRIDPNSYPLEYELGSRIFMQIEATSSINNTELFVESCRAAPYDNPSYHQAYSIIENGCKVDPTVQTYSSADKQEFRFSMEAFKFIGLHNQVYISCSVVMCEAGNTNTRCSMGCINSTGPVRGKREAHIQTANHFVSQGPLRLRRSAQSAGATVTNLNLNLVFIAGCVLAAVGMICGVAIYKSKMAKVKYQPLPTSET
ncbi:CUB/zona pellucida-like domains 1-like protein-like [Scophthalmus maximus]|uniref:CUB/zona pellucida-like domains 1-like protein-like n=1 Tax=Scophthalmus maximus TaxID=52904 RepID=A0A2U9BB37_SCOMX|nr:CUB/zona pellucida-like domains 1-like protein-like [Scophthalmus maximus]